jgi:hypothetical protein
VIAVTGAGAAVLATAGIGWLLLLVAGLIVGGIQTWKERRR